MELSKQQHLPHSFSSTAAYDRFDTHLRFNHDSDTTGQNPSGPVKSVEFKMGSISGGRIGKHSFRQETGTTE